MKETISYVAEQRKRINRYMSAEAVNISSTDATPTLQDSAGNPLTPIGVYVGGAGTVICDMAGGTTSIMFAGVPVGTFLPIAVTKVYKSGTTATSILFMY